MQIITISYRKPSWTERDISDWRADFTTDETMAHGYKGGAVHVARNGTGWCAFEGERVSDGRAFKRGEIYATGARTRDEAVRNGLAAHQQHWRLAMAKHKTDQAAEDEQFAREAEEKARREHFADIGPGLLAALTNLCDAISSSPIADLFVGNVADKYAEACATIANAERMLAED